ncbi:hypothetical protein HY605_05855 [Candidatus Peregrinibacteria bacterium]|nr:hypothetical protein [Candidatus Peregrinibacteria bacterium]
MMDNLLKLSIHTLLAFILARILLFLLGVVLRASEVGAALWKLPTIIAFFVTFLVLSFLLLRKVLPLRKTPLINNRVILFVTLCFISLCILIFCVLPSLFSLFLLEGYRRYNQPYLETELPPDASYVDLANTAILNEFSGARLEILERYLSSNKKWNVCHWDGRKAAFLRRKRDADWEISLNMYFSEPDFSPELQYRVGIYLGHELPEDNSMHKSLRYATAGTKDFRVPMIKSGSSSSCPYESWLWVKGKEIGVEIFEQSKDAPRIQTRRFLEDIYSELLALRNVAVNESILHLIVPGSYANASNTSFEILDGMQPGIYEATGYVNPGKKGYIYIKAFDKRTGQRLSENRTKDKLEYPGWSSNSEEKFYYRFEFTIYEGDWSEQYPAILELWFKPSDGSAEEKLTSKEMMIYGWQR